MTAGTVLSGGFPGRVAQEVTPNPKCRGCLHFADHAGRTGACTIGLRPWLCGDGDAQDIGYAPIARGMGSSLPDLTNRPAQAPEVAPQEASSLHGAGSTRPVRFQQVSLGEEHVHFVKSFVTRHVAHEQSMCRLCKSRGSFGMAPANTDPQICTCAPVEARTVAKALMTQLSNRERSRVTLDEATQFVYDVADAGFKMPVQKSVKIPRGGHTEKALSWKHEGDTGVRGTDSMHAKAPHGNYQIRVSGNRHALLYAPNSGKDQSQRSLGRFNDQGTARTAAHAHHGKMNVAKADAPRHPHDLKPGDLVTHSSSTGFHHPDPKVAATHGEIAQVHSVKNHPHSGEPIVHVRYHESSGKMSKPKLLSGYDSTRHPTTEDMAHHAKHLKRHFNAAAKLKNPQPGE